MKWLAVHFFTFKLKMFGNSRCYRVRRHYVPHKLFLVFAPRKMPVCADQTLKRLRYMSRMKCNKSHTEAEHSVNDFVNYTVGNITVKHVSPPHQNVCVVKDFVCETALVIVETGKLYFKFGCINGKVFSNKCVNAVGIKFFYLIIGLLVTELVPYSYFYFIHY